MMRAISMGLLAAIIVALPRWLWSSFPRVPWYSPICILVLAFLAMLAHRFWLDRKAGNRSYDGIADLFLHIHQVSALSKIDTAGRWFIRSLVSFFLTLFGGIAGAEGAAIEGVHASLLKMQSQSARWFEQRRRSDAALAISTGIAAAFQAPFAAILIPVELGIGGSVLPSVIGAMTAFLGIRFLSPFLPEGRFSFEGLDVQSVLYAPQWSAIAGWLALVLVSGVAGVVATALIRFIRYGQESLQDLFQSKTSVRVFAGGVLLFLVVVIYRSGHLPSWSLLEQVFWAQRNLSEVGLLFLLGVLSLSLMLSAFGTLGVFWPLFVLGGLFGYWFDCAILNEAVFKLSSVFSGVSLSGFSIMAGFAGAAAFWGAILGAPMSAALVAWELTQNPNVIIPCFLSGFIARWVRDLFKTSSLVELDLLACGLKIVSGRSSAVLDALHVRDALVSDHEVVHEREPVADIYVRIFKMKYPFLPVVNAKGAYLGMLTVDQVREAWQAHDPLATHIPLSKLVEAKDLLYRLGAKTSRIQAVQVTDRLSSVAGLFEKSPCLAVVGEEQKLIGLLFDHQIRVAYDREVLRRSFLLQS